MFDVTKCGGLEMLKIMLFGKTVLDVLKIGVTVILIIMASLDCVKMVVSTDEERKKTFKTVTNRLMIACVVFLVPTLLSGIFESVNDTGSTWVACYNNTTREMVTRLTLEKEREDAQKESENDKIEILITIDDISVPATSSEGASVGQTYNLTNEQLRGLANVCQREQDSVTGAKAEASLMANRFELFGSKYGTGGTGLYNYVRNSGWFASSKNTMGDTSDLRNDILVAVKSVLVLGQRTLALYVDEHDCIDCGRYGFDVIKLVTDGNIITSHSDLKKHNNYVKDKTKIYNKYGAIYTFYTFPTSSSDPFGYTDNAYKKINSLNG